MNINESEMVFLSLLLNSWINGEHGRGSCHPWLLHAEDLRSRMTALLDETAEHIELDQYADPLLFPKAPREVQESRERERRYPSDEGRNETDLANQEEER